MSYILEALKKSEQERARGREQDLLQFPAAPPAPPSLRPGMVLGLSALLLAGGIAIGWWQPWRGPAAQPRPAASQPVPEQPVASVPAREPDVPPPAAPTRAEALRELRPLLPEGGSAAAPGPAPAKPSPGASAPAVALPEPAPAPPAPQAATEAAPVAARAPAAARSESRPAAAAAPKPEERKPAAKPPPPKELPPPPNRVLAMSELPAALREALPPLTIRGFVHSDDPASRLVVVNERMLREGDEIAAELTLERIDPDGMVLNFRGYRFVAPR